MSTLQTNIVRQGEPSRSALTVASLRAVHQLLDEPLVFPDRIALPLLGASAEAALRDDPFVLNDPMSRGLRGALVVRSRFVEDELARCVAAGVRQYVLLGAGLDTFAYRNPYSDEGLRVFEVDHAGTQRWKQQLLAEARIGVPASLTFVPVDFERDELDGALRQSGFRADQPACVSWMGVTMYLTADAVLNTLGTVAGFAAGSCLCFDYRVPETMLNPIERVINEVLEQQIAARYWYEHWFLAHLYFDDLPTGEYFDLVRSRTPPGSPIEVIATRRPYDDPGVACKDVGRLTALNLPQPQSAIPRGAQHQPSIGAEHAGLHRMGVTFKPMDQLAACHVPQPQCAII